MFSAMLGEAARDADELMYMDGDADAEDIADESWIRERPCRTRLDSHIG
jgi:hypothetical protein